MSLQGINDERDLSNYELTHLSNVAKRKGITLNPVKSTSVLRDDAEYGVMVFDSNGKKKKTVKFSSLELCQAEVERHPGSMVVRLGRNFQGRAFNEVRRTREISHPIGSFLASVDESGNIETPENEVVPDVNVFQLISNELVMAGYPSRSGARPSAEVLRGIAMRYNDIVPEEFAAAVVKHCEIPKISEEGDAKRAKIPFKSLEEKRAWYDTPAGQAWTKEHPVPSIFNLPTPEYIHRRG